MKVKNSSVFLTQLMKRPNGIKAINAIFITFIVITQVLSDIIEGQLLQ